MYLFLGLWMSRDHLDEDNSRTDTGCESHDTLNKEKQASHLSSSKRDISLNRTSSTARVKPDRVMGRREQNTSNEHKPDMKTSISMPLKSALRQPRTSQSSGNEKPARIYRSNSLPRDTRVEFTSGNIEAKRAVKTVRYDDTVKSAEITQDLPTNLSPEESLLPAKREAPIGGHDEKYSENTHLSVPAHQSGPPSQPPKPNHRHTLSDNPPDIRDSIVNARRELIARKPDPNKNNVIPTFDKPEPHSHKGVTTPQYPPNYQKDLSSNDSRSIYRSHEGVRQPSNQYRDVPFSHYTNNNGNANGYARQSSQSTAVPSSANQYTTSSLPRPPKYSNAQLTGKNGTSVPRRTPLPSYEEIQSSRSVKPENALSPNQTRPLPSYSANKQSSQGQSLTPRQPAQTIPTNRQPTVSTNRQSTQQINSANRQPTQQAISATQYTNAASRPPVSFAPSTKSQTVQRSTSVNKQSVMYSNSATNKQPIESPVNSTHHTKPQLQQTQITNSQPSHQHVTQSKLLATQYNTSVPIRSEQTHRLVNNNGLPYQRTYPDVTNKHGAGLMSPNNAGSCSSSNPDSGYSGHFNELNTNRSTGSASPADYKHSIQSTALRMTTQQPLIRGHNLSQAAPPHFYSRNGPYRNGQLNSGQHNNNHTLHNGVQQAAPTRTVYSNMTSDV